MTESTQFLINEQGEKIAAVISMPEYEKLLDELEELWAIRECDQAKASGEVPVPLDQALPEIKRARR